MIKKSVLILSFGFIISACEPCYVSTDSNIGTISNGACERESGILPQFNPFTDSGTITSGN